MTRVLYLGRFNPPHLGHLEALKYIFSLDEVGSVLIGIGSAQESFSLKNPLTGGERFQIIENILDSHKEFQSKKYFILPLLDLNNNNLYVSQVIAICPPFSVVFSNNPLVKLLYQRINISVKEIPLIKRDKFSGTIIRNKMINGENWKDCLPESSIKFLEKLNIVQRLKILSGIDN